VPGYVPSADPTFIELHHDGVDLASGGDSGGPYFYGGTAFGTLSGAAGANNIDDGIFMAANYIVSGLGVSIMTSP